jgi:hypothetical protein
LIPIMGIGVRENLNIERIGSESMKTHANRVGFDGLILFEQAADAFDDEEHLYRGRRITQREDRVKPELVAHREVLEAQTGKLLQMKIFFKYELDCSALADHPRFIYERIIDSAVYDGLPQSIRNRSRQYYLRSCPSQLGRRFNMCNRVTYLDWNCLCI